MVDATVKKWSVTYTKHIKQKRKVYQDGFLELHTATTKVMLYDDCEKLLECRLLKNDEDVSSGETMTFNAYLVDVGDPEGDHKPVPNLSFQVRDKKVAGKPNSLHGHRFRNNPISADRKASVEKSKVQVNNLSPSRRIIREFKKSELHKFGTPRSSPDTTNSSITEWQVLYTTQVTQKAKKYHDGFLRLSSCGSMGRQVILYDQGRTHLNSRFLKKDEVIRSGESIAFDRYLVEIGECEENHQPSVGLNVQGNNCYAGRRKERTNGQGNCPEDYKMSELPKHKSSQISPDTTESSTTEWEVLYTTQVTQKAKKYHDGFLQLATRGSFGRQIMLYDASRNLLGSRNLKKDESIKSGQSIAFDTQFLVDVGEPKGNHEFPVDLDVQRNNTSLEKTRIIHGQQNFIKAKNSITVGKPQSGDHSIEAPTSNLSFSELKDIKLSTRVPTKRPLRDANQILSILQKPMALESVVAGCTDKSMTRPISFIERHQVSDASLLGRPGSGNSESPRASAPYHSSENADTGESSDFLSSRAISNSAGSQFSKDEEPGNSYKPYSDTSKADTQRHDESCAFGISNLSSCASRGPDNDDDEMKDAEPRSVREMDNCPTFDLGF